MDFLADDIAQNNSRPLHRKESSATIRCDAQNVITTHESQF